MRKFKRLMSVLMSAIFAFSFCLVWDKGKVEVKAATAADTVLTEFLNSGYDFSDGTTIYDGSDEHNYFQMSGRRYYQGMTFDNYNSCVSFDVENYSKISFDLGHVDNSGLYDFTLSIYRDGNLYREVNYSLFDMCKKIEINLSGISELKLEIPADYGIKAIGDICLDENAPSITHSTPVYENEEFLYSWYDKSGVEIYDGLDDSNYFQMNGSNYYQGITFNKYNAYATLNVENVDNITFCIGHIDNTDSRNRSLRIYLDNNFYYTLDSKFDDEVKAYKIDTSDVSIIRFDFSENYCGYGLANLVLDENYDSITDGSYSDKSKIKDIDLLLRKGDIDGNGTINLYDVIAVAKYMMGMITFNSDEMLLADYNEDSKVDLYDAVELAKLIMK
ncbi:MAG: dockerin type I repeat-containing protein [Oscillospiraceae bacterium]|nr:dockerin type I repeat-containing protein [Oscillospiraceae bacterium]